MINKFLNSFALTIFMAFGLSLIKAEYFSDTNEVTDLYVGVVLLVGIVFFISSAISFIRFCKIIKRFI